MGAFKNVTLITVLLLLNFLTATPLFALTKTRGLTANTYEKIEVQFLSQPETAVEVACEAGDELISGGCNLTNRTEFPNEVIQGVIVDSKSLASEKAAWSCKVRILDPRQELRLTSAAKCRKPDSKNS
jgi:hypothetical protein